MLTYNSQLKTLVLPEYGRNIQQMVDHCLTIEDRDANTPYIKKVRVVTNVNYGLSR